MCPAVCPAAAPHGPVHFQLLPLHRDITVVRRHDALPPCMHAMQVSACLSRYNSSSQANNAVRMIAEIRCVCQQIVAKTYAHARQARITEQQNAGDMSNMVTPHLLLAAAVEQSADSAADQQCLPALHQFFACCLKHWLLHRCRLGCPVLPCRACISCDSTAVSRGVQL